VLERPVGGPGPWHDAGVKTASGSRKPGTGTAKTGRHLKLTSVDELPRASVRRWLRTAAELARRKGR
jgi:hypothetical protein